MAEGMNRRELTAALVAAGATFALPETVEAQKVQFSYAESTLSRETLELHKERAVAKLRASIPPLKQLAYLFTHAQFLKEESQMYIPDERERQRIITRSIDKTGASQLDNLSKQLSSGESGLYIFADKDDDGRYFHRMYVLKKESSGTVRFEKAYRVSASLYGFGNEEKSNKTPLGLHRVQSGEVGGYAEVVRAERNSDDTEKRAAVRSELDKLFNRVLDGGVVHWFARTFGESSATVTYENRNSRDRSEVVTARYTIDEKRGIHIHGTNRSGMWDKAKNAWITFLGGRRRSSGCIRMSNTDVYDLGLSGHISLPRFAGKRLVAQGTSVMIHSTDKANGVPKPGEKVQPTHPDDKERNLFEEMDEPPKEPEQKHGATSPQQKIQVPKPRVSAADPEPIQPPSVQKPKRRNLFEEN